MRLAVHRMAGIGEALIILGEFAQGLPKGLIFRLAGQAAIVLRPVPKLLS